MPGRPLREESELREQPGTAAEQGEIVAASVSEGAARVDPRSAIRAHGRRVLGVDTERLHFFDPDTGDAVSSSGPSGAGASASSG